MTLEEAKKAFPEANFECVFGAALADKIIHIFMNEDYNGYEPGYSFHYPQYSVDINLLPAVWLEIADGLIDIKLSYHGKYGWSCMFYDKKCSGYGQASHDLRAQAAISTAESILAIKLDQL